MQEDYKLGLTLSGGGAKGAAHIGVIKALEERGLKPDIVSGTSAGSIIGSLYCMGVSADEMLDLFLNTSIFRPRNYTWKKPGIINTDALAKILKPLFPEDDFESLNIPMYIVATDILKARSKVFSQGPLITAMLSSCSFPFIFAPVEIDDAMYCDGGILNNFPVELIRDKCEKLIGVNSQHIETMDRAALKSSFSVVQRVFSISTRLQSVSKYHMCDVVIAPMELSNFNTFDMYKIRKMYDIGYEESCKKLDDFLKL